MDILARETFELVFSYLEPRAVIEFGLTSKTRLSDPLVVKFREQLAERKRLAEIALAEMAEHCKSDIIRRIMAYANNPQVRYNPTQRPAEFENAVQDLHQTLVKTYRFLEVLPMFRRELRSLIPFPADGLVGGSPWQVHYTVHRISYLENWLSQLDQANAALEHYGIQLDKDAFRIMLALYRQVHRRETSMLVSEANA